MKKNLLAIMREDGAYLSRFELNEPGVLAWGAGWSDDFQHALTVDWDVVKDDEENTDALNDLAQMVDGELVLIKCDYTVVELATGAPRKETDLSREKDFLKAMVEALRNKED